MTLAEKIQKLIFDIETLDTEMPEQKLPQNVYYLNDQDIVCLERKHGESRYPWPSLLRDILGFADNAEQRVSFCSRLSPP